MTRTALVALVTMIVIGVVGSLVLRWMQWPGEPGERMSAREPQAVTAWTETPTAGAPAEIVPPGNLPTDAVLIVPGDWDLGLGATLRLPVGGQAIELVVEQVDVAGSATTIRAVNEAGVRAVLTQGERSRFGSIRLPNGMLELWGNDDGTWIYRPVTRGHPQVPDFKVDSSATVRLVEPDPAPRLAENPHR